MTHGYIYVLQNKAFGPNVVKIGFTKRAPELRAREIYAGATGVPMPFDIAVAYTVANYNVAEKRIHKRLAAYRLNSRREFFRISPAVAALISLETCAQVNTELGLPAPQTLRFSPVDPAVSVYGTVVDAILDESDGKKIEWVNPADLAESPIGKSLLTPEQHDRAHILHLNLSKVTGIAEKRWFETFSQDEHPERELRIWEHIAKAFMYVDGIDIAPDALKKEAYHLLLQRSWSSTGDVLAKSTLKHISHASAKRLLDAYGLRPKPFLARRGIRAS